MQGKAERVSPEAPVLVLRQEEETRMAGGAANVALNVAALGVEPLLLGALGAGDEIANGHLRSILSASGISTAGLVEIAGRCTTVKTRFLAQGQHLLRYDKEDTAAIGSEGAALWQQLEAWIAGGDITAMVLQDYNKGVLTPDSIERCLNLAKAADVPVIVDPKQANFFAYRGCELFKPNLREAMQAVHKTLRADNEADLYAIAAEIGEKLACRYVCITLGERGAYLYERLQQRGRLLAPLKKRHAIDICGAGDTVVSALSVAIAKSWDIEQAVQWANLAGGQVCERIGVVQADAAQLAREWAELSL